MRRSNQRPATTTTTPPTHPGGRRGEHGPPPRTNSPHIDCSNRCDTKLFVGPPMIAMRLITASAPRRGPLELVVAGIIAVAGAAPVVGKVIEGQGVIGYDATVDDLPL